MGHLKLHEYQEKGIEFWYNQPRAYFAVDMGLGKTAIILHAIAALKIPTLIIAPLRTIYTTWLDEVKLWDLPLKVSIVHGDYKEWALQQEASIYVTNFQSIPFIYNTFAKQYRAGNRPRISACVIDEGSMIKSSKTKRFKYLDALRQVFPKYRAILSGTPAPNSLLDLWAQYFFLTDGDALGINYESFKRRHFESKQWEPYTYTLKKNADKAIYKRIQPYTYRLDEKDHAKLPPISYNHIQVKLSDKLMEMYKELKNEFLLEIRGITHEALNSATLSMKLRQFLQGFLYYNTGEVTPNGKHVRAATLVHKAKLEVLKSLVEETDSPIMCAIQFKEELAMIQSVFPDVQYIAGGTSVETSVAYQKEWNAGKIKLLVVHPVSVGHGLNLQAGGNIILWYCNTWSLEQYLQLNKRLYRQGQKTAVIIHHLTVAGTIDDKVAKVLNTKNLTQQALLDFLREESNYE